MKARTTTYPNSRLLCSAANAPLVEQARAFVREHTRGGEVLLLAETRTAADEVVRAGMPGCLGVHRHTLEGLALSFARAAMADQGLTPLSRLATEALVTRVAQRLARDRELRHFASIADTPGFPRALSATLAELRVNRVGAATIDKVSPDLAALLAAYQAELERERLADYPEQLALAIEGVRPSSTAILLLDPSVDSALEEEFVAALAGSSPTVLALAHAHDTESVERLSRALAVAPETIVSEAASGGALQRLRQHLFADSSESDAPDSTVQVFSAASDALECVEIARRLKEEAAHGRRFDQMAVLLRDPGRYSAPLEEALRRAGIPSWFSQGSRRPDAAGRAFLALLDCAAENYTASAFAEYVAFGQVPVPEGENWTPAGWERRVVDAAVIGGVDRWQRRLEGLAASIPNPEDRRRAQIENLRAFAVPLIGQLDALPRAGRWSDWIAALSHLATKALKRPESVLRTLDELQQMAEVGPVTLAEVRAVLGPRLRDLREDPVLRRYGRVFVASLEEARGSSFDVVFVPGLAEGAFPRRSFDDPLLLDPARSALDAGLPVKKHRAQRERLLLRLAAAAARRQMIVSYPRMDALEGRPRVPSFYALEVLRAAEGRLPGLREFEERTRSASNVRLGWPAPLAAINAIDAAEYDLARLHDCLHPPPNSQIVEGGGRYLVEVNPALARSLRGRWRRWDSRKWHAEDGLITEFGALDAYQLDQRTYSPSALERYARCPYQFALHAIFRLRVMDRPTALEHIDAGTRGILFHLVQSELLTVLERDDLLPISETNREAVEAAVEEVLAREAAKVAERLAPAIDSVWRFGINDLLADLRGWIDDMISRHREWMPIASERAFGDQQEELVQIAGANVKGTMDLVERHMRSNVLRVTDFKTGKPPSPLPACVGQGEALQPLLYALAAQQVFGSTVRGGRLYYATRRGGYVDREIPLTDETIGRLEEVIATINRAIGDGFLPPAPVEEEACEQCEYHLVCGPREDLRHRRKSRQSLEPLERLRSMP